MQLIGKTGGVVQEVSGTLFRAGHVVLKPLEYVTGAYRVNHRCAIIAAQAANSRLFELRNVGTNHIIPTRLVIKWFQNAAHTAAIEDSLDVFKVTGFTVVDTTNTVTPVPSAKLTTMTAAPAGAAIRGVTVAGAAAGMTGGTLVKDASPVGQLPLWLTLAFADPSQRNMAILDVFDDVNGTMPFRLATSEGFIIENRVLLGAAAGSSVYIDCSYVEVSTLIL